jgi:hypothetical protein
VLKPFFGGKVIHHFDEHVGAHAVVFGGGCNDGGNWHLSPCAAWAASLLTTDYRMAR